MSAKLFSYEPIATPMGTHYRVRDSADNRIATCWQEANAMLVVRALNREAELKKEDRDAPLT